MIYVQEADSLMVCFPVKHVQVPKDSFCACIERDLLIPHKLRDAQTPAT